MKRKHDAKVTKGMIFAGCSFTWGQGLYYYSNLPTLSEPLPDQYDPTLLTSAHISYMEHNRYPRIVANHFNTFEAVNKDNGGSNKSAIHYWNRLDKNNKPYFPLAEYSFIIFQMTQWQRNDFEFKFEQYDYYHPFHRYTYAPLNEVFGRYLDYHNITLDKWIDDYIQQNVNEVKSFLYNAELQGLKTLLFTWPRDYIPYIEKDSWLRERFVTFDYKDKNYTSIETLMHNFELEIKRDYANFDEPPIDHHPSMLCHQIMAENLIKRIKALK